MFGFFKKNKKSEEELHAESLPIAKKVQFEAIPIDRAEQELDRDLRSVLSYTPVNYYAEKNKYLQCVLYYNNDYSEVYMRLVYIENDVPKGKTKLWKIDSILLRDILRKFGQQLPING